MPKKNRNHDNRTNTTNSTPARRIRTRRLDPWELVWGQPYIDCETLAAAIEDDLERTSEPDYRSRLLIHDAAQAIRSYWGPKKFARWVGKSPLGNRIETILQENFPEEGFPRIRGKLVASVKSEVVERIFELVMALLFAPRRILTL
jgi:hypothetical protein